MKQLFRKIEENLAADKGVVLCSVIASSGSVPRGAGAKMAVFEDRSTAGTIGGGAVEYHAIELAMQIHVTKEPQVKGFLLTPNQVADIGMICGGNVTVYFQYFAPENDEAKALIRHIRDCLEADRDAWLITEIREKQVCTTAVYDGENGLRFGGQLKNESILPLLQNKAVLYRGETALYVEPLVRSGVVYVFGGGHVSRELVPLLHRVGFRVVLWEDRPAFAAEELFPDAEKRIVADYRDLTERLAIREEDYIVVLTPGHQADFEVLRRVLRTGACYIGCIGSRRKVAATRERLLKDGFIPENVDRIHSPIGLEILAETPAEIAVSIAAEMIRHRAARS